MSEPVLIMGDSGAGKSYSLRNMDPKKTLIISVDGKRLPFKAKDWPKISSDNPEGSFYIPARVSPYGKIKAAINAAVDNGKKSIVIDDSQFLMGNEFFDKAMEKGFDKFSVLGQNFWKLIEFARDLPDDIIVYFLHHIERDPFGHIKPKTIGKMLDEKGSVEGRFTICLLAEKVEGENVIHAQLDDQSCVKAPFGMFEKSPMDNDLAIVDKSIREFWGL